MTARVSEAEVVLRAWESGRRASPTRRALVLAAIEHPEADAERLERASLGWRNRALLLLHRRWFGQDLEAYAECPACSERLETAVAVDSLLADGEYPTSDPPPIERDGFRLEIRLPSSRDLLAVEGASNVAEASGALLRSCVTRAARSGSEVAVADVPAEVLGDVPPRVVEADPLVEVLVELTCPACAHVWEASLDPATFLWRRLAARAQRILDQVGALARAFGWSERDILAMTEERRAAYLERVGS